MGSGRPGAGAAELAAIRGVVVRKIRRGEALVRELHYEFSGEGNGVMYHGMALAGGGEPRDAAFEHSHELMTLLPLEAPVRPLWSALAMHAARATARAGSDAGAEASLVDRARIIAALCAWFEPDTHGESTPMVSNADIDLFFRMCQCKLTQVIQWIFLLWSIKTNHSVP